MSREALREVDDFADVRRVVAELTEGVGPGPWHAERLRGTERADWWLENPGRDASFPDGEDVAVMLNALPSLLLAARLRSEPEVEK